MTETPQLKEKYVAARCCRPAPPEPITGYFSHDDLVKVHRSDCANIAKAERDRLITLDWGDILVPAKPTPGSDFTELDRLDFEILQHHQEYDIDYSLMVAKILRIDRRTAFERHEKLRNLGLLERVEALMVRYRKNTIPNKWIKHRNHTYYRLTRKGIRYLEQCPFREIAE